MECLSGDPECTLNVYRSIEGAREFSVSSVEGKLKVSLLRPRRKSGRRPGPLREMDDYRGLGYPCEAEAFAHQHESASRSGGHGSCPRISGPYDHVYRGDLIFHLLDYRREKLGVLCKKCEYTGTGRHGISGNIITSRGGGSECNSAVAVQKDLVIIGFVRYLKDRRPSDVIHSKSVSDSESLLVFVRKVGILKALLYQSVC